MVQVCVDPDDFDTNEDGQLVLKKGCGLVETPDGPAPFSPWTISARVANTVTPANPIPLNTFPATQVLNTNIVNPSPCRPMRVKLSLETGVTYSIEPGTTVLLQGTNSSLGPTTFYRETRYRGTQGATFLRNEIDVWTVLIPPGGNLNLVTGVDVSSPNYTGGEVAQVGQALTYIGVLV